jgi:hypothetical protein
MTSLAWIPAFAGMTSLAWIPAFAGMTSLAPAERARREVT